MVKRYLFFSLFLFSCIAALTCDARQGDHLTRLMQAKKAKKIDNKSGFHVQAVELAEALIPQEGSKAIDKIQRLPGQLSNVNFTQYGGYVTIDEQAGRALYYYFAEVDGADPSSKPLVLWLNGGPGCSSLGIGAFTELGPFRVHSGGKTLYENRFAWNKVANVLFLESPAGVGFSYSNTTSDYSHSGDNRTAIDNYVFLVNWLERYSEYKSREFYLAGESYAGHYVPQLAHTILKQNELANKTIINLKGIMIGNAVINDETDEIGMYDFLWTHALISDETLYKIHKYCNFSPNASQPPQPECYDASDEVGSDIQDIDIYNIYAPLCLSDNLTPTPKRVSIKNFDPCSGIYVHTYLNLPEVQEALHAVTRLESWTPCSQGTDWDDSPWSVLNLFSEFFAQGIRVWVYSGDTDGIVPVTSTRSSLNLLKLEVKSPWRPWYNRLNREKEVGGYTEEYKGDSTLVTVRGAGHEVPSYQPPRALTLIDFFLKGEALPSASAFNKN